MNDEKIMDPQSVAQRFAALRSAIAAAIIGQDEAVRLSFITLLCSGHSLYEGVPGLAKTLLVRALAATLGIRFGRIQCTADLLPSDIIGTPIFSSERGDFHFRPGPLFTDLLLVDEINRAPAKTQAALLEAMQKRAVTVDGIRILWEIGSLCWPRRTRSSRRVRTRCRRLSSTASCSKSSSTIRARKRKSAFWRPITPARRRRWPQ
jgi:MoxR-like ATPase